MDPNDRKPHAPGRKAASARARARIDEDSDDWIDADDVSADDDPADPADEDEIREPEEAEDDEPPARGKKSARTATEQAKTFFESLGQGIRTAGETATRYTRIGVAHAELEKLRFDLKSAHAKLGEAAMRCWADAPDLGLTSKDPAVAEATKLVKDVRRKIREKEAKIAQLKKDKEKQ